MRFEQQDIIVSGRGFIGLSVELIPSVKNEYTFLAVGDSKADLDLDLLDLVLVGCQRKKTYMPPVNEYKFECEGSNTEFAMILEAEARPDFSVTITAPGSVTQDETFLTEYGILSTTEAPETVLMIVDLSTFRTVNIAAPAGDTCVQFGQTVECSLNFPAGASSKTVQITLDSTDVVLGEYLLNVRADPDNVIAESNEVNNFAQQTIAVLARRGVFLDISASRDGFDQLGYILTVDDIARVINNDGTLPQHDFQHDCRNLDGWPLRFTLLSGQSLQATAIATGQCTLADLTNGAFATITVTA
jgi:hypothetical protein